MIERGNRYDHSLMHHDFQACRVRVGDQWTKIDYSEQARESMKPLVHSRETDSIEIPTNSYLDDMPPMMFIKGT